MAQYGILNLSASTGGDEADSFSWLALNTSTITASTLQGNGGNDVLYFGAQGYTANATATYTQKTGDGTGATFKVVLNGRDVTYTGSTAAATGSLAPVVTAKGVITAYDAVRGISNSLFYGNAGNDSIMFGTSVATMTSVTVGAGAGNDIINFNTYVNSVYATGTASADLKSVFVEAGGGDDSVSLTLSAGKLESTTVQGSQGNDTIAIVNTAGATNSAFAVFGGGGNDSINVALSASQYTTVAGGGGSDTISYSADGGDTYGLVLGDTQNQSTQYDGDDVIKLKFLGSASSFTVQGQGGNDVVNFDVAALNGGNNLFQLGAGNDSITGTAFSADTIQGGAGNDTVALAGTFLGANGQIILGGDNDALNFVNSTGGTATAGNFAGTVFGGLGADRIGSGWIAKTGDSQIGMVFGYSSFADSTISAMDVIAVGGKNNSKASYQFNFVEGGLSRATFGTGGATATDGVVTFSSTFESALTARYDYLAANVTAGGMALFRDGGNVNYLFIQGSSSSAADTLIQIGTAGTASGGSVTLAQGKNATITLA